jgi:tetratricopeptide (TPR) repeat protein
VTRQILLLSVLLLFLPAAARAEWFEASSTHFRVYAEGDAKSVRAFATRLERFDKGLRFWNRIPDEDLGPANRVTVYVVPDMGAVQRLARAGPGLAGFYIGRAGGSVAFTPRRAGGGSRFDLDAETILLHEYAHHFLRQNIAGSFPAWFVEGFAEFYSTARFDKDGSVAFGLVAEHRASGLMNEATLPIEVLLDSGKRKLTEEQMEATIYGRGWLLTHFLTFNEGRSGQLGAYLTAIRRGASSLDAARSAFGDLRKLDRELRAYARQPRLTSLVIAAEELPIGPVRARRLTQGEAAILPLRMQMARGTDEEQANALIGALRRAAAPFPNDPAVQATLAEGEYEAGNLEEAQAAADRALAVQPRNVEALIWKGRAAIDRVGSEARSAAADWKEARRLLLAANAADPNHPVPFILFYESFAAEGVNPTRNAVAGLLRAFELAPQDTRLRLIVARQHLVDGKPAEARDALAPLAFDPHGGARTKAMQTILARLDESGAAAALAAWDGAFQAAEASEGRMVRLTRPEGGGIAHLSDPGVLARTGSTTKASQ